LSNINRNNIRTEVSNY